MIVVFFNAGVASVPKISLWASRCSNSKPDGVSAACVVGCEPIAGVNCNALQPVTGGETDSAFAHCDSLRSAGIKPPLPGWNFAGLCHESIQIFATCGTPEQSVGFVKNGTCVAACSRLAGCPVCVSTSCWRVSVS